MAADPILLEWLASHDAPCPVCSYNLRGLKTPSCPECGAPLHLAVGSENLNLGPWILAIAGPMLAVGFDGVVSVLMTLGLVFSPPPSPGLRWWLGGVLGVFIVIVGVCAVGLWMLMKRRRAWMTMPPKRQWAWAWGIIAVIGTVHVVYGAVIVLNS